MHGNGEDGTVIDQAGMHKELHRIHDIGVSRGSLKEDKSELKTGGTGLAIKIEDQMEHAPDNLLNNGDNGSIRIPKNGFFSPADPPFETSHTPVSSLSEDEDERPPLPDKDSPDEQLSNRLSPNPLVDQPSPMQSGRISQTPEITEPSSNGYTNGVSRSSPLSSMVFVITALESIAASKEARKRRALGDSVQIALSAIKQDASPNPEVIFHPLELATQTTSIPLTTTALDCIGKLITYSYFSLSPAPTDPSVPPGHSPVPIIERAIDTICDCFQDESTPAEIQLQIVKSLLAAVLNDKIIVHGAGLLKAVRQIYNIFLLSRSSANQQVAQGTLTQMVGTVFERVKTRLAMKEARLHLPKGISERGTLNGSQTDLHSRNSISDPIDVESSVGAEDPLESNPSLIIDQPAAKDSHEKLTLQSFENVKNFDDTRIADNAPTMVTRAKMNSNASRTASGRQHSSEGGSIDHDQSDEEEEDEIYVKDAFLVFRSMCRLSTKTLPQDQLHDLKSQNMRSKLISLAIIRTLLNNNMAVFVSPLVTIRSSVNNEPTSFGEAINQYLRLTLSRNGASSVRQVFEISCEVFWLMLKDMRVMLKVGGILWFEAFGAHSSS